MLVAFGAGLYFADADGLPESTITSLALAFHPWARGVYNRSWWQLHMVARYLDMKISL